MATKEQLLAAATELGINVDALPQDGQDGPSNKTLQEAIDGASAELAVDVDLFALQTGDTTINVPLSGLLRADPELRGQELKPSEWRRRLDAYLNSERH